MYTDWSSDTSSSSWGIWIFWTRLTMWLVPDVVGVADGRLVQNHRHLVLVALRTQENLKRTITNKSSLL